MIKKHIPNAITLMNLLSGSIAVIYAVEGELVFAAFFVVLGIFFDYFDGFFARILNVKSELGLQLDSLADMVTSGVAPGVVMFQLLGTVSQNHVYEFPYFAQYSYQDENVLTIAVFGLFITLASCYRLANFNIDTRQTDSFIGLPTPANTLLILSLPLILETTTMGWIQELMLNKTFLLIVTALSCFLLNAEIPLFALKFKTFGFKENAVKYLFLIGSIVLLVLLQFIAIPIIIFTYVAVSLVLNAKKVNGES